MAKGSYSSKGVFLQILDLGRFFVSSVKIKNSYCSGRIIFVAWFSSFLSVQGQETEIQKKEEAGEVVVEENVAEEILRRRLVFFPNQDGGPSLSSELIPLVDSGLGLVLTEAKADFRNGIYQGEALNLVVHDPVSRLSLVRIPVAFQSEEEMERVELGQSISLKPGDPLFLRLEKEVSKSVFVSRESEYDGQALPLELLRIHHEAEEVLQPGQPIFDAAGRLVAIHYRSVEEFGNASLAFPVEVVQSLKDAEVDSEKLVRRTWFGVELLASDPMAVVQGVRQESPATKAGIQQGDVLLRIGPRRIRNYAEALNSFYFFKEGQSEAVSLLRGTELVEVMVVPEFVPASPPAPVVEPASDDGPGASEESPKSEKREPVGEGEAREVSRVK